MLVIDELISKIKELNNPTVIGLDPRYDMLPNCIKSSFGTDIKSVCSAMWEFNQNLIDNVTDIKSVCSAMWEFNQNLIDNVCDIIPAVKPQAAFYEALGLDGIELLKKTCEYAKQKGMFVILDAKRGDIGSTSKAYSNAYLGKTKIVENEYSLYDVDFLTVNPYLGVDGIKPFTEDCEKYNKGIFVLVKTSNPSSSELQDLKLESRRNCL